MLWKRLGMLIGLAHLCIKILICCFFSSLFILKHMVTKLLTLQMDNTLIEKENEQLQDGQVLKCKKYIPLSENDWDDHRSLIVFDFETSGLQAHYAEILQISAIYKEQEFDMYVKPVKSIDFSATAVNHLKMVDNILFYKENPVDSVSLDTAMIVFLKWIESIPPPRILMGHNAKRFDCKFLMHALCECNLTSKFCSLVIGFVDTMPLARAVWPGMPNYQQKTLVEQVLKMNYEAHNGIEDVRALQKLISSVIINKSVYLRYSFTSNSWWEYLLFDEKVKDKFSSYHMMLYCKGISDYTARKLASNNIGYGDLLRTYRKGGEEEVTALLGKKVLGKVVGTVNPKTIGAIVGYLEENTRERM